MMRTSRNSTPQIFLDLAEEADAATKECCRPCFSDKDVLEDSYFPGWAEASAQNEFLETKFVAFSYFSTDPEKTRRRGPARAPMAPPRSSSPARSSAAATDTSAIGTESDRMSLEASYRDAASEPYSQATSSTNVPSFVDRTLATETAVVASKVAHNSGVAQTPSLPKGPLARAKAADTLPKGPLARAQVPGRTVNQAEVSNQKPMPLAAPAQLSDRKPIPAAPPANLNEKKAMPVAAPARSTEPSVAAQAPGVEPRSISARSPSPLPEAAPPSVKPQLAPAGRKGPLMRAMQSDKAPRAASTPGQAGQVKAQQVAPQTSKPTVQFKYGPEFDIDDYAQDSSRTNTLRAAANHARQPPVSVGHGGDQDMPVSTRDNSMHNAGGLVHDEVIET